MHEAGLTVPPTKTTRYLRRSTLLAGSAMFFVAGMSCSSPSGPDAPDVSLQLSTVTAAHASLVADGASTTTITVALKDADGAAVPGLPGGVVLSTTSGSISTALDAGGGIWTATLTSPTVTGVAVVTAKYDGMLIVDNSEVTFTPGAVASASVASASTNGQTGVVGKPVANPPSVKVMDAHGNVVPGITVTFTVTGGGGSVSGATQTTGGTGTATVGSWTLGSIAGPNTLAATVGGEVGAHESLAAAGAGELVVTFTATGVADAPGAIALNAGDGQTAVAGTPVTTAPSVKVVDGNNNAVSGATVTFAVASGGGSIAGATASTNSAGIATVGSWTLGNVAGANTLTAAAPGVSGLVTFSATGVAGPAASMEIANAAAANQTAAAGSGVALIPSVRVLDARGNPVPGVEIMFAVVSGGGSVTGANATTNSSGIATVGSWVLGSTAGPNSLAASSGSLAGSPITFTATGLPGSVGAITIVGGNGQTGTAGSAVGTAPSVKVSDANGNAVPGAVVTFSVASGGGSVTGGTATTNANGVATVGSWTLGPAAGLNRLAATSGGVTPVVFEATGVAGAAAKITVYAGNNQTAPAGSAVAVAPAVLVADANDNPVAGAAVVFAVGTGGGSITAANPVTNADGVAAAGSWTLGAATGVNTVTATATGLTGSPVTFTATAIAGPPANLVKFAGDAQNAVAGTDVPVAPAVKVTAQNGLPLQGISVTFTVASGGGSVTSAVAVTTDAGIATVGSWKLGNSAGANTLTAAVASLAPVTFTATGTAGPAAQISINGGNNQTATVGTAVAVAPSVRVTDANGNVVSGAGVTFAVASGGGTISGNTGTTSAAGTAAVGSWTLGQGAGPNTLMATLNGVSGASVTFTATGVDTPPLSVAINGRLERGQTVSVVVTQSGSTVPPSGYSLALEPSDGGLVNSDGSVKLLKSGSLRFTATASPATGSVTVTVAVPPLIVFDLLKDGARHIWEVALDGGDLRRLTTLGSDNQHPSRVGDRLVYASARSGLDFNIWSMTVSTGTETQLTSTVGADTDPHISNDGMKLTFVTPLSGVTRAVHSAIDGSGVAPVADNSANIGSFEALPAWSPGSDKVIFSSTALRGDMDLWITSTLGGVATHLGSPANNASSAELSAAWSSDNRIAFLSNRAGNNEIWITDTDGSPASRLTDGSSPTWLADGRIVFVRFTGSSGHLYWIDPANPGVVVPINVGGGNAQRPSAVRP